MPVIQLGTHRILTCVSLGEYADTHCMRMEIAINSHHSREIALGLTTFVLLVFGLLTSAPAFAQLAGATLSGTVTDQSGAVIPNTQIAVKSNATGVTRTVTTDPAGFHTAPNLLSGTYEITATASGFRHRGAIGRHPDRWGTASAESGSRGWAGDSESTSDRRGSGRTTCSARASVRL
jgi:hypothetical protein